MSRRGDLIVFYHRFSRDTGDSGDIPKNNIVSNEEQILKINEMKDREKILFDEINKMSQQLAKAIEEEVQLSIVSAEMDKGKINLRLSMPITSLDRLLG